MALLLKHGIWRTSISEMYRKYRVLVKMLNLRYQWQRENPLKEQDHRWVARILKRDRHATLSEIFMGVNARELISVSERIGQQSIIVVWRTKGSVLYRYWLYGIKLYSSTEPAKTSIYWWMELYFLVRWVSFPVASVRWTRHLCIETYESMDSTCQYGTVQSGEVSVMIWEVWIWLVIWPLIRLTKILIKDKWISIHSNNLNPLMSMTW